MARIRSVTGQGRALLDDGWQMALAEGGAFPPKNLDWIAAAVPGTAAQALEKAGKATPELLASLQSRHIWYRRDLSGISGRLRFGGLTSNAEIRVGHRPVLLINSMFDPVLIEIEKPEEQSLFVHFKPLFDGIQPQVRRQKWRPHLISNPNMRNTRASLLGHMPGWCSEVQPVGLYRPVELINDGDVRAGEPCVFVMLDGTTGHVEIACRIEGAEGPFVAQCWNAHTEMQCGADGIWRGTVEVKNPPLWWPHTSGEPHLVPVAIYGDGVEIDLGKIGFRSIELDWESDGHGFGLVVNGERLFCRGVNWTDDALTSTHGTAHNDEGARFDALVRRVREMGANMIRIPGITTRMPPAFFDACDRHGIFVWMDEPLANFDYDFEYLQREFDIDGSLTRYLEEIETSPSLAVACGGSEMAQQGAMLSLPAHVWTSKWCTERLPEIVSAVRPDVITVPNSPWGGELPFQVDKGVSHYYGVGAYMRPLEDARRANVRFASECLAFANLPQPERLALVAGDARPGTPEWKALVVRDLKADWDFEDVRDHYLGLLYGVDVGRLRNEDPARYLTLSTVVPGEVMETTFAEWRRVGSITRGGLVWLWQDLKQGFGWGVTDWQGVPKPAYFALQRAFAPLWLGLTDEGVNGLHLHLVNEGGAANAGPDFHLTLTCYDENGAVVIDGAREISLPPRTSMRFSSAQMFGIFFDVNYAYKFGLPAHVVTVARLVDARSGHTVEAFHFPQGRAAAMAEPELAVDLEQDRYGNWVLVVRSRRIAQSVHVVLENGSAQGDWFHLAPGLTRIGTSCRNERPRGVLSALNSVEPLRFG